MNKIFQNLLTLLWVSPFILLALNIIPPTYLIAYAIILGIIFLIYIHYNPVLKYSKISFTVILIVSFAFLLMKPFSQINFLQNDWFWFINYIFSIIMLSIPIFRNKFKQKQTIHI